MAPPRRCPFPPRRPWRSISALLFVYGTLRPQSGHPMAALLRQHGQLLGPATMRGDLVDLGGYPGALPQGDRAQGEARGEVRGEVLRLRDASILRHLDAYEGGDYERALCDVKLWDGSVTQAWVYLYRGPIENAARIPAGDWLQD